MGSGYLHAPVQSTRADEGMSDARERFVETMGRHFEEEGVPRIAGRLCGRLMLEEEECSLDDLAEALQVSKGSISSNARLLEDWGVAERVTRPGDRRDYYRLAPDIHQRLLNRQVARIELAIRRFTEAREELGDAPENILQRFDDAVRFNRLAIESLRKLAAEVESTRGR